MRTSQKAQRFTESVIREMTRIFNARGDRPGANLAQGFPDFPAPEAMKEAACRAIRNEVNQYAITWGAKSLREAIADKTERDYGYRPDPERELTVACGATEAMIAALLALVDPGDEVIVFEPYYENYGPDAILSGAKPRFVRLHAPDWRWDERELRSAFNERTRAIVINTPNNPTGRVFDLGEMSQIAELCAKWDVVAITDEIYEHIVYEGQHHSMATLPGMRERTVTISGLSKTYSATGWRIGWLIAPPEATSAIRKVHDFLTVGAAAPLQEGAAVALRFAPEYYADLAEFYRERRDFTCPMLRESGFEFADPEGAYYILADFSRLSEADDVAFARWLIEEVGVATVPGSSFYVEPESGRHRVRFCFCKRMETLHAAARLLEGLRTIV
ncbi:MAG TPA: aminotransferase class I/II-fold pyridoxal phosphate-dependent enzyme [Fimbriimonadaceae bacterium]|nr:aminotransferase class I/II-fold pyridoxal phosphate-dependent enzyme [Fimbriimonadaceae bacterium]HRJ97145.1 aminotransferase class I/II-fold pyridoxal phosphate-dependent enzyme [Fimbriimonadaceae bacterium]